jgi:hypothetical protein
VTEAERIKTELEHRNAEVRYWYCPEDIKRKSLTRSSKEDCTSSCLGEGCSFWDGKCKHEEFNNYNNEERKKELDELYNKCRVFNISKLGESILKRNDFHEK